MSDRLPQVFGRYVLRERVGQGGMAEVFRASLPGFGGFDKQVAIKRMFRQYGHDAKFIEMLTDEAKIVSQLAHPNIVQILDVGQIQQDYFIAFEYVEGVDLFRLLQRHHELGRDLPVAVAAYIVAELCSALDYAHSRRTAEGAPLGIVHRDVSPQNVLLSLVGEVKLTDFGIAKAAYRYTHTQAGMVKGKIYYMSPEQALGQAIDHRSDLFSAGILLFETLVTRPLYDEVDQHALYDKVCAARYAWPADKAARVPQPLRTVVDRALQPQPGNRYQTGRVFREAILAAVRELGPPCDREAFGAYLRSMYEVAENRPPSVVAQLRRPADPTSHGDGQAPERWHSVVAALPGVAEPVATTLAPRPMAGRPSGKVPLPGSIAQAGPAIAVMPQPVMPQPVMPAAAPQAALAQAGVPPPLPPRTLIDDLDPGTTGPAAQPRPRSMPAAAAPRALPRQAPVETPGSPPRLPVPAPARPQTPQPAPPHLAPTNPSRPPRPAAPSAQAAAAAPSPRPTGSQPAARPATMHPQAAAPVAPVAGPADPRRTPAPAPPPVARHDEATSMLDSGELERRLADSRSSAAPASEPAAPLSEAATRFIEAMPDDDLEDTTRPRNKKPSTAPAAQVPAAPQPAPAAVQPVRAPTPVALVSEPPPAVVADPDEAPASWQLLAVTAAVWTCVLLLGVYATLLTVAR